LDFHFKAYASGAVPSPRRKARPISGNLLRAADAGAIREQGLEVSIEVFRVTGKMKPIKTTPPRKELELSEKKRRRFRPDPRLGIS
jgi:hypothetical protein